MKKDKQLDYEHIKQKALEQLRMGKSLYGTVGTLASLLRSFLDSAGVKDILLACIDNINGFPAAI